MKQFIPSSKFDGSKQGYFFGNGDLGIGYYLDKGQSSHDETAGFKRKRLDADFDDIPDHPRKDKTMDELLEEADETAITQLDATSLKQMLVTFEKKINQNQKLRIKYADEPSKFMESEFELNQEIQNLHVVAAYPSLYPIILSNNSLTSILGMITHENTDISIMTVSLLQEMIDADSLEEARDEMIAFIESFIALNGLELITQNLHRLNEFSSSEDAQGVYNTLAILDSLVEIDSNHAVAVVTKTNILSFLVKRITNKEHDANKVYASEVLSILTQHAPNEVKQLILADESLLDNVLQSIAQYRKKDVVGKTEEQELVENIFLALNTLLTTYVEIQDLFLKLEGLELLLRCWQFQEYVAFCGITTMNLALLHHPKACQHFIDIAGLKYLFAYLTLIGKPSHHKYKKVILQKQEALEDSMVSIVSSLCLQLSMDPTSDYNKRLLVKLIESNYEKLVYVCTLYVKYDSTLRKAESEMVRVKEQLEAQGDYEELEELLDPDNLYLERLENGLLVLQQLAAIIAYVCRMNPAGLSVLDQTFSSEQTYSNARGMSKADREHIDECSLANVLEVLREQVSKMLDDDEEDSNKDSAVSRERGVYLTWIAVLSNYAEIDQHGQDITKGSNE